MPRTPWTYQTIGASLLTTGAAIGLGTAVGLFVLNTASIPILVIVIIGLIAALSTFTKPELGLITLVFITYTRFSDILVHHHGAPSLAKPFIGLLILMIFVRWWWLGIRPVGWQRAAGLTAGYGLAIAASFLVSDDFARSQIALGIYIKDALVVLIITSILHSVHSLRLTIWALLAAGILMGTISLHQQLTDAFHHNYWGFGQAAVQHITGKTNDYRLAGPIGDPNFYAQILLVLIPLALDRLWRESTIWARLMATYALFVCSWAFIFTFSRGGLVALAIALGIMFIRRPPRPAIIVTSAIIVLLMIPWIPSDYTARITTIFEAASSLIDDGETDTAMQGRLSENLVGWQIFMAHPILGVGLNNYPVHYRRYAQRIGLDLRHEDRSAHNLYLQIAAETGLLGLTTFGLLLWIMFRGLRQTFRLLSQRGMTHDAEMVMSFLIAIAGYLIAAIFLHSAYPRYFWLLFGIALAIAHIGNATVRDQPAPHQQQGALQQHAACLAYD